MSRGEGVILKMSRGKGLILQIRRYIMLVVEKV